MGISDGRWHSKDHTQHNDFIGDDTVFLQWHQEAEGVWEIYAQEKLLITVYLKRPQEALLEEVYFNRQWTGSYFVRLDSNPELCGGL